MPIISQIETLAQNASYKASCWENEVTRVAEEANPAQGSGGVASCLTSKSASKLL